MGLKAMKAKERLGIADTGTPVVIDGKFIAELCVCNCEKCGGVLIGRSERAWYRSLSPERRRKWPPIVFDRVNGRPYCAACCPPIDASGPPVEKRPFAGRRKSRPVTAWHDAEDPGYHNATRVLEDAVSAESAE